MTPATILLADDDTSIRIVLQKAMARDGYHVRSTDNAATLWKWVSEGEGDLVVTDVVMPDENAFELLPRIKRLRPDLPVVLMSAQNTILTAITAAERGAYEYLPKPFDLDELMSVIRRALKPSTAMADSSIQQRARAESEALPLIGRSPPMQEIYRILARLMNTDLTVMIVGESGTGKELVARVLHDYGRRRDGPFVAVNMAAIPRDLIESELFGHEKGSFTGAISRSTGRFEQACHGTLFLDEIGDMPLEAQTRLLRVLQEGEYTSVGGGKTIKTHVRIITATHHNLRQLIDQGRFREDLYYRLNVVPVSLPPLRDRLEDIPDLARYFLLQAEREDLPFKILEQEAFEALKSYDWPGNVRELENLIRRMAAIHPGDVITAEAVHQELSDARERDQLQAIGDNPVSLEQAVSHHIDAYFTEFGSSLPPSGLYDRVLRDIERPLIQRCLKATRGNQVQAAHVLGLNRNTLRKKIRDLEIDLRRDRVM